MASTYRKSKTNPFIWIRFKDENGKWKGKPTGYRFDNPGERIQAERLATSMTRDERESRPLHSGEQWNRWVDAWLVARYGNRESRTLEVYRRHWRRLQQFIQFSGIRVPRQALYRHVGEYREWRLAHGVGNNSIIHELKFWGVVQQEAVRRGYADSNPFMRMGLSKDPPKRSPPWPREAVEKVAQSVHIAPQWLQVTFWLGLYQADRLKQCEVPLDDIDLERERITYRKTKGNKPFTQPIDPSLKPILKKFVAERRASGYAKLCDIPMLASVEWREFLDVLGFPHLSHHGLRRTWITLAATSGRDGHRGVSRAEAMRFVNHGSASVHEIYQALNADDISHVPSVLGLPSFVPKSSRPRREDKP